MNDIKENFQYESLEEKIRISTEKYIGNGWYVFDEGNDNHQAVLKDFPYADIEEIPLYKQETDTTITYGYDIKYTDEVKRRIGMREKDTYELLQNRYIEFMEQSRDELSDMYNIDFSTFKFAAMGSTGDDSGILRYVNTTTPYITVNVKYDYSIVNEHLQLKLHYLMGNTIDAVSKRIALNKLLGSEINDYSKWLQENTDGCEYVIASGSTGLGFEVEERLYGYLKDLGMKHQEAKDYKKRMYEIIESNKDKSGQEIKEILKKEIGLESYSWIEFKSTCGLGGNSPVRPTGEEVIRRKELYKELITYSDIKIRTIYRSKYSGYFYYHPSEKAANFPGEYASKQLDKFRVADKTIDDHKSWYKNRFNFYEKNHDWATTILQDRRND